MIVVSDTSPLNYLVLIGCVEVLPSLFTRVVLPSAVIEELRHPRAPADVKKWADNLPGWAIVRSPGADTQPLPGLDRGESEALALAEELRREDSDVRVLIDERAGRQYAAQRGFEVIGLLAVLVMADESRMIQLSDAFRRLRSTTFFVDEFLLNTLLQRARRQREH